MYRPNDILRSPRPNSRRSRPIAGLDASLPSSVWTRATKRSAADGLSVLMCSQTANKSRRARAEYSTLSGIGVWQLLCFGLRLFQLLHRPGAKLFRIPRLERPSETVFDVCTQPLQLRLAKHL